MEEDKEKSIFDAEKVLVSILKKYGCIIYQKQNLWHIVRVRDWFNNLSVSGYSDYNLQAVKIGQGFSYPKTATLGSQINGFDFFHAKANQRKEYQSSLGAYKVFYKYGIVKSIIDNSTIIFSKTSPATLPSWTLVSPLFVDRYETNPNGDGFIAWFLGRLRTGSGSALAFFNSIFVATSDTVLTGIEENEVLSILMEGVIESQGVTQNELYVEVSLIGTSQTYYLNSNGAWTTSQKIIKCYGPFASYGETTESFSYEIESTENAPVDGNIQVRIAPPMFFQNPQFVNFYSNVKFTGINVSGGGAQKALKGESFTATKTENRAAVVELEDDVYVGDSNSDFYEGAIEDIDGNNTNFWARSEGNGIINSLILNPLLHWLALTRLETSFGNSVLFKGGFYNQLAYGSKLSIDGIDGVFMTLEYTYDTRQSVGDAEHLRIYQEIYNDNDGISVSRSLEGENVIRPVIE